MASSGFENAPKRLEASKVTSSGLESARRGSATHKTPPQPGSGQSRKLPSRPDKGLDLLDLLPVADLIPERAFELSVFEELRSFFDCLFERFLEAAAISRLQRR